jgi:hypothetical protein
MMRANLRAIHFVTTLRFFRQSIDCEGMVSPPKVGVTGRFGSVYSSRRFKSLPGSAGE